jgi:MscS family membrane protein
MRAYIRANIYTEFLAIQEDIMLRAMKLLKQAGTGFALRSQTLYICRYDGLDDTNREVAEKRVREWASAQELPFPQQCAILDQSARSVHGRTQLFLPSRPVSVRSL